MNKTTKIQHVYWRIRNLTILIHKMLLLFFSRNNSRKEAEGGSQREGETFTFTLHKLKFWWTVPWRSESRRVQPGARTEQPRSPAQRTHITAGTETPSPDPSRAEPSRPAGSVWSPAFVHGSNRSLPMPPTRCSSLHLQFKPWGDDRRPQLTGKCPR